MHWLIPKALISPLVVSKVDPAAAGARHDPLAAARRRGALAKTDLLRTEGGALSASQVARHLGISLEAVEAYRTSGSIIALPVAGDGYLYPAFQVTDTGITDGLRVRWERVIAW